MTQSPTKYQPTGPGPFSDNPSGPYNQDDPPVPTLNNMTPIPVQVNINQNTTMMQPIPIMQMAPPPGFPVPTYTGTGYGYDNSRQHMNAPPPAPMNTHYHNPPNIQEQRQAIGPPPCINFLVPMESVPLIIGRKGETIQGIATATNSHINVSNNPYDPHSDCTDRVVKIARNKYQMTPEEQMDPEKARLSDYGYFKCVDAVRDCIKLAFPRIESDGEFKLILLVPRIKCRDVHGVGGLRLINLKKESNAKIEIQIPESDSGPDEEMCVAGNLNQITRALDNMGDIFFSLPVNYIRRKYQDEDTRQIEEGMGVDLPTKPAIRLNLGKCNTASLIGKDFNFTKEITDICKDKRRPVDNVDVLKTSCGTTWLHIQGDVEGVSLAVKVAWDKFLSLQDHYKNRGRRKDSRQNSPYRERPPPNHRDSRDNYHRDHHRDNRDNYHRDNHYHQNDRRDRSRDRFEQQQRGRSPPPRHINLVPAGEARRSRSPPIHRDRQTSWNGNDGMKQEQMSHGTGRMTPADIRRTPSPNRRKEAGGNIHHPEVRSMRDPSRPPIKEEVSEKEEEEEGDDNESNSNRTRSRKKDKRKRKRSSSKRKKSKKKHKESKKRKKHRRKSASSSSDSS